MIFSYMDRLKTSNSISLSKTLVELEHTFLKINVSHAIKVFLHYNKMKIACNAIYF